MELIILIVLICIGVGVYATYKNGKSDSLPASAPPMKALRKDPFADTTMGGDAQFFKINIGDLIKADGKDFFVRRSVTSTEAGYTWHEFLLDDGVGTRRWLSVENDDGLDLGWWDKVGVSTITGGEPGSPTVNAAGTTYTLKEKGGAHYTADAQTEDQTSGNLEYLQYESADGSMLSFQRYDGGPWDASLGERRRADEFDIYPASQS